MVGLSDAQSLHQDDRLIQLFPSWFMLKGGVHKDNLHDYLRFLSTRYSDNDWNRLCTCIVPDKVFDEHDDATVHYQNLPGLTFMKMRLLRCIRENVPDDVATCLAGCDLCDYFRKAFV